MTTPTISASSIGTSAVVKKKKKKIVPKVTALGTALRPLNLEYGKVVDGWATTLIMCLFIGLFAIFLLILLQIYNQSILLPTVGVSWESMTM
jgi:photosystem II PsbH protein